MSDTQENGFDDSLKLVDGGEQGSYLTRCVAIVTILHEFGILDELIQTGRLDPKDVDRRVDILEKKFPGFRALGREINQPD